MKAKKTIRHEVYCYHCDRFHPVSFPVTAHTDAPWFCPNCGTSLEKLYHEVDKMPYPADRLYCYPHRARKVHTSLGNWMTHRQNTSRHPIFWEIAEALIIGLIILLCIPVVWVLGILAFPVIIGIGLILLLFAPWHTGGLFWFF